MTREQWEQQVLRQVRDRGGFVVFWATANQCRACAIDRLEAAGRIVRVPGGSYPWCAYRVEEIAK